MTAQQIASAAAYQSAKTLNQIEPGARVIDANGVEYVKIKGESPHVLRLHDGALTLPACMSFPVVIQHEL